MSDADSSNSGLVWEQEYDGFESLFDLQRDVTEAFDPAYAEFHEKHGFTAHLIPAEYEGTVIVKIYYREP